MTVNKFNFCPQCASENIQTLSDGYKWVCGDCGFKLYLSPTAAVAVIITDEKGRALLQRRAKDPGKGKLGLTGGFCDRDETAEDAVIRECTEEVGVAPTNINYIGAYPNTYKSGGITYKTCDMCFHAQLPMNAKLTLQASEVASVEWIEINSLEQVMKLPMAFESQRRALLQWASMKLKANELAQTKATITNTAIKSPKGKA